MIRREILFAAIRWRHPDMNIYYLTSARTMNIHEIVAHICLIITDYDLLNLNENNNNNKYE